MDSPVLTIIETCVEKTLCHPGPKMFMMTRLSGYILHSMSIKKNIYCMKPMLCICMCLYKTENKTKGGKKKDEKEEKLTD